MMLQQENLMIKYANKIRDQQHFQKILEHQDLTFDYKPFKIDKLSPGKALIIYRNLDHRYIYIDFSYNSSKEFMPVEQGWHQYQKRLYVWFMVIYAYYLEKEGATLITLSHYRQKINFDHISRIFFGKSPTFLEFQFLSLFKVTEKILWNQKDDKLLVEAIENCPGGSWTQISMEVFRISGKERFISSKNCRQRWQNHLDRSKVKGNWTLEQDKKIIQFVHEYGKKWSKMRGVLNNKRTEHMIKNRYHSLITKNKAYRYEKQQRTSKRLLELYEIDNKPQAQESIHERLEEAENLLDKQGVFQQQLKEENISDQIDIQPKQIPEPYPPEKSDIQVKQEIVMDKQVNESIHISEYSKAKLQEKAIQNDQKDLYPFENYNNSHYDQFFDYQNAHYIMLCQQYNNYNNAPTNDSYIDQNPQPTPANNGQY